MARPRRAGAGQMDKSADSKDHDARLLLSVGETARQLSISETYTRELVEKGEIFSVRLGKRILIPQEKLTEYVARYVARLVYGHSAPDSTG